MTSKTSDLDGKTEISIMADSGLEKGRELTRGTCIDRYVILDKIGEGGMGIVYKAYDPELDRQIAVKLLIMKPGKGEDTTGHRSRLLREAQALAKLSHPNVVAVYDVGTFEGDVFIAMELVEGRTLRRWLRDTESSRKQIVDMLIDAGRGLCAAHEAELVHRDFKPENVIIGSDGRVRVLDFGLARAAILEDEPKSGEEIEAKGAGDAEYKEKDLSKDLSWGFGDSSSKKLLCTPLTKVGSIVGTPAYMAPEQHLGREVDARTDQFSFCIVLYEALYGVHPFTAKKYSEGVKKVTTGEIGKPPVDAKVPAWQRRILLRGLSADPVERYPSMEELLDELKKDPAIVWRRAMGVALLVAFVCVALWGVWWGMTKGRRFCQGSGQYLTGVWDATVKQRVQETFLASGLHYAKDTFLKVERLLDEHCGQWVAMHGETCEATHVHGTQSDEMLDLKMGCLKRKLGKIKALIEVFGQEADAGMVEKAVQAVSKLGTLAVCKDEEYLTAVYPPPEDPQARARVKEIRQRLDRVEALDKAGKYNKGLELLEGVREKAGQINHPPLNARDLYLSGLLLDRTGKYKEAEEDFYASILQAAKAKDYQLYAKSWNELIGNIGYNQARYEEALELQLIAESALEIADNPPDLRADLFNSLGIVFYAQGKYDKALEHYQRALTIREKALGPEHPRVAKSLNNMGIVFYAQGKYDKVLEHLKRSLTIKEKALGPEHPYVASSLNNLGVVFYQQGKYDKALEHHQRALTIKEKALGPEHPDVAISLNNLGLMFYGQGKYDKALEHYQRALDIREKALGPEHPDVASSLSNLGEVFNKQGKYDKALAHHKRALNIKEKALGVEHPHVAVSLNNLGKVFREQGKYDRALEYHQRALTVWEKALGAEHPDVVLSLNELGKVFGKQGKYDKALRNYERASAICEKKTCKAEIVPEIRFDLARSLWVKGGPSRGRSLTLAERARDAYSKMEQKKKEFLEVEEWLKKREGPGK